MDFNTVFSRGPRVQVVFSGDGRTRQSMRDESDINVIMAKYAKTGYVNHLARHGGDYAFASSVSFHEAMNIVTRADQMFSDLPAKARVRFGGDPAQFLEFVQDSSNFDEMVVLGLADPKPAPAEAASAGEEAAEAVVPAVAPVSPVVPAVPPEGG